MGCSSSTQFPVCSPSRAFSCCQLYRPEEFVKILLEVDMKLNKHGHTTTQYFWPLVGNPKRTILMQLLTVSGSKKSVPESSLVECLNTILSSPYEYDINATTNDDHHYSALDLAAGVGPGIFSPHSVLLLLKKGARADKLTGDGFSPLHLYCRQRNHGNGEEFETLCSEIIPLYLVNGADINVSDAGGRSPLYWAISSGHPILVKILLLNGAKPDQNDFDRVDLVTRYDQSGKELVKKYLKLAIEAHKPEDNDEKASTKPEDQITTLRTSAMVATLNPQGGNIIVARDSSSHKLRQYQSSNNTNTNMNNISQTHNPNSDTNNNNNQNPTVNNNNSHKRVNTMGNSSNATMNPSDPLLQSLKNKDKESQSNLFIVSSPATSPPSSPPNPATPRTLPSPTSNPNIVSTMRSIPLNIVPKGTMKALKQAQKNQQQQLQQYPSASHTLPGANSSGSDGGTTTPTKGKDREIKEKEKDKEAKMDKNKKYATMRAKTFHMDGTGFGSVKERGKVTVDSNGNLTTSTSVSPPTLSDKLSSPSTDLSGTQSLKIPKKAPAATMRIAKVKPTTPSMDFTNYKD